jgi:hypothetical protein
MTERENLVERPEPRSSSAGPPHHRKSVGQLLRDRRIGPTAVLAVAALVGLAVWLVLDSRGNGSSSSGGIEPTAMSAAQLKAFARKAQQAVYWVGPRTGDQYEVTQNSRGAYIRYLPAGTKAGESGNFTTVGTYPVQNAYAVTKTPGAGTVIRNIAGGGVAATHASHPKSVYVAYPGANAQIEIYAPDPRAAQFLATSGQVQPVLGPRNPNPATSLATGPKAATLDALRSLAARLGHPIYWGGPRPNTTYELWQTTRGYTYIRYLPRGVPIGGGSGKYLIVATYPMKNAFSITKKSSRKGKSTSLTLPEGGIAAYAKGHPTNVYVAFPGVNAQVEVYDPHAKLTPKLVASGQIVPVR